MPVEIVPHPPVVSVDEIPRGGKHLLERPQRIVDLTREIYQGMPIWQNHQRPQIWPNHSYEESCERFGLTSPFRAQNLLLSEHTGTHTDAIYEYTPAGPSLDVTPLEFYYGSALCLDVSHVRYPDHLTPEVLEAAEAASGDTVTAGDIVLLHTGHGARTYPDERAYLSDQTGLSHEGAVWLAEKGVVNIGIDAVAIDHSDDLSCIGHVVCGQYGIVNTESLTNLDQLVNQRFTYYGLPLNIRNGTGSPIRAIAVLDN
jgi:kynurenine formamidase